MSARRANLCSMATESTAVVLTERIDALAAALRAAGVSPEQSSGLLSAAAAATMHAVTLQALLDEQPRPAVTAESSADGAERRPAPVALAA
jgi:hypothetical protein